MTVLTQQEKSSPNRFLLAAAKMTEVHRLDEFMPLIIEGRQRLGKSAYSIKSAAQALGEWGWDDMKPVCEAEDYEAVKQWLVFQPREFMELVLHLKEKTMIVIWDDAGYWLFSLDWYTEFVKTVSKYLQLAGTQIATIILTTPSRGLLSTKVMQSIPDCYIGIVSKHPDRHSWSPSFKPRICRVFESWNYPDGKKGGVHKRWSDSYDAMLPNDIYAWYAPRREKYLDIAMSLLEKQTKKLSKQLDAPEEEELKEEAYKAVGDPDLLKQVNEVLENNRKELEED
ncbi:hypothetical protein MUP77_02995 [Candidatus Bathyarchaeota archaeon]|nr:hypothetical protein [Candidatus Bathyarchaeota archaeon]